MMFLQSAASDAAGDFERTMLFSANARDRADRPGGSATGSH